MQKFDFVTITFNSNIDLALLKIQAVSFKYVDINLINSIIIIFNDNNELIDNFNNTFYNEIKQLYPIEYQDLIKVIYLKDLNLNFKESNWFTQQIVKLKISFRLNTKYYLMLDSKNHFINNINWNTFFDKNTDKPILYYNMQGKELLEFYYNNLNYFNVNCPNVANIHPNYKIQTITPYMFITDECKNLIKYIENKEKIIFEDFFIHEKKYTEFYLYFSYLIFSNKLNNYEYNLKLMPVLTIGPQNPAENYYNTWKYKTKILENNYIDTVALHRLSIYSLDNEYKNNLLNFYKKYFNENELIQIKNFLYNYYNK
jgi:hypothetical protein